MNAYHRLSLLLLLTFSVIWGAEPPAARAVGSPKAVTAAGSYYMAPRWSPDGGTLALTGPQYAGIYLLAFPGGEVVELADDPAAGSGLIWSPSGQMILTSVSRFENHRRHNALVVLDALTGQRWTLTDFATGPPGAARWDDQGQAIHLIDRSGRHSQFDATRNMVQVQPRSASGPLPVMALGAELVRFDAAAGESRVIDTVEGRKLNLALSPDGGRMAFEIMGGHLWVTDTDGGRPVDLGVGNRPSWSPGGDRLAYTITEDDGHQILSADIYVVNADGSGKALLRASDDVLEMHPAWSPDGRYIAYDDLATGRIFIQEVR